MKWMPSTFVEEDCMLLLLLLLLDPAGRCFAPAVCSTLDHPK